MSTTITHLLDDSFSAFLADHPAVVVDFWAPWCGPCKSFAPTFEATADKFLEVAFVKVNVDEAPGVAAKLGIRSIPTMVGFKGLKPTVSRTGTLRAAEFEAWVNDFQATSA